MNKLPITIEANIRPEHLLEPVESKLRTLKALESVGAIEEVTVRARPDAIPVDGEGLFQDHIDVYETYREWANVVGVSLAPGFTIMDNSTIASSEPRRVLRTPVFSIGIYLNGVLTGVFPHSTEERHYSVGEAIALIRTGELLDNHRVEQWIAVSPVASVDLRSCPECGRDLANVQGIPICTQCEWQSVEDSSGLRSQRSRTKTVA